MPGLALLISIEPDSIHIPDDAWEWVETTPDFIRHRAVIERFADGNVAYVYRTQPRALNGLLEANRRALDESQGKRFADMQKVASIPLNVLFDPRNQLAEKLREGDTEHLRWYLNREEARPFRNFRGKV